MEKRLHMESKTRDCFIEQRSTDSGQCALKILRKFDSRFKGQRIKEVLQAYPDEIPLGSIVNRGGRK